MNFKASREAELTAGVRELEPLVGQLSLDNEFLKKALKNSLTHGERKESSLPIYALSAEIWVPQSKQTAPA